MNLPAHLVVIKSTQQYQTGGYKEYSDLDIMQMIGRAGRPQVEIELRQDFFMTNFHFQFDTFGVAVIMTADSTKATYERMVSGKEIIESRYLLDGGLLVDRV